MASAVRHKQILELARQAGHVTVEELAQRFGVSAQTIRRDLNDLCETSHLTRTHGGAMLESGVDNLRYDTRRDLMRDEKESIGRLCAAHVPENSSVFINIGTTTEAVARHLLGHFGLMVITNNINVALTLAPNPNCEIVVAGGVLRRSDAGLVGEATTDFIRQFKVDVAVIGASALDPEDGALLDFDYREVRVAQAIVQNARRVFLVADASKFTRSASVRIASFRDLDAFFTDQEPPASIRAICREHGVAVHVARA